eukprot:gene30160-36434_t
MEGRQMSLLIRSMTSIVLNLPSAVRDFAIFHIFYGNTSSTNAEEWAIRDVLSKKIKEIKPINVQLHRIDQQMLPPIKVWGRKHAQKLSQPANFIRFYAPALLKEISGAQRLLYLDTDSVAVGDIRPIYHVSLLSDHAIAAGLSEDYCNIGKVLRVQHPQLLHLHLDRYQPCLTASVLMIDIERWLAQRLTEKVESYILQNNEHELYLLGSMPPLILAVQTNFTVIPQVYDGKHSINTTAQLMENTVCATPSDSKGAQALLIHPVKDLVVDEVRSEQILSCLHSKPRASRMLDLLLKMSNMTAYYLAEERQLASPRRILMASFSGCDCISCVEKRGSVRIGICNLGNGLKRLGYAVTFVPFAKLEMMRGHVFDAVITLMALYIDRVREVFCFNTTNPCPAVLIVKPHNLRPQSLALGVPVFDSMVHLQGAMSMGYSPLSVHNIPVLRLLEVPTSYWKSYADVSFTTLEKDPLYSLIPRHEVYTKPFSLQRKAKLCYHGTYTHITYPLEADDLLWDLNKLLLHTPALHGRVELFILSNQIRNVTATFMKYNITAEVVNYVSINDAYAHLSSCDLGLVPNLIGSPMLINTTNNGSVYDKLEYNYKISANGGRAFLFAQLGVPMIGHPEFEFIEMLAMSGIDKNDVVIYGMPNAWWKQIIHLLADARKRQDMSRKLRLYAEKDLHIMNEIKKLEYFIIGQANSISTHDDSAAV